MTTACLADTSVFIARESGRKIRMVDLPERLAVSVITIGELRAGVLAAPDIETADNRLDTLQAALMLGPSRSTRPSPQHGLAFGSPSVRPVCASA